MASSNLSDQNELNNENEFFSKANQYWINVDATVDGMLGGFSQFSEIDLKGSERFISEYFKPRSEFSKLTDVKAKEYAERQLRALDLGSGIGRITRNLLLKFFEKVDMVDQCEKFLKESQNYIGKDLFENRVTTFCTSLHIFKPVDGVVYDLIWLQWVSGYLYPDNHLIDFLNRCKLILKKPHGLIVLKDNHTSSEENDLDTQDGSVTRSYMQIISIIKQSGFKILQERRQNKFPKGCYPIKQFMLKPIDW